MMEEMWKEMIVACFNLCTCLQLLRKITEIRQVIRCSGLDSNQTANESSKYVGLVNLWSISFRYALRGCFSRHNTSLYACVQFHLHGRTFCVHMGLLLASTKLFLLLWCVN